MGQWQNACKQYRQSLTSSADLHLTLQADEAMSRSSYSTHMYENSCSFTHRCSPQATAPTEHGMTGSGLDGDGAPAASVMDATIARPRPELFLSRDRALSARTNRPGKVRRGVRIDTWPVVDDCEFDRRIGCAGTRLNCRRHRHPGRRVYAGVGQQVHADHLVQPFPIGTDPDGVVGQVGCEPVVACRHGYVVDRVGDERAQVDARELQPSNT